MPGPIDIAGTLESPAQEALNAFHARWQLYARSEDFELRDPEASPDVASIGIARREAASSQVVRVSAQEHTTWIRLSVSKSKRPADMTAAARVLRISLDETSDVLLAASTALRHMRTVARLATDLYSARSNADALERTLDLEAHTAGLDAAVLKDPRAQRSHVGVWEDTRDRFNAEHGPATVVATGSRARSDLIWRFGDLVKEQDALWTAPIKTWLWSGSTPERPGNIVQMLALLPRAASNVAARIARIRQLEQDLHVVEECQRIIAGLEDAHERLANAEALHSARLEERRLVDAVLAAVKDAATPVERPTSAAPYTGRPAPQTSRTLEPPTTPGPGHARGPAGPPSLWPV
ncbi:hypothetical protein ACFS27_12745 [Promicromonospora vindobonensis]|uniref:Uncharacterized protein n=1 Tax=Promicromonospora vindobonensis TaxID=195748 RepID=A0ABW5VS68_9MICO